MISRKEKFRLRQDYPEGIPGWMIQKGYSEKQIRTLMQGRRVIYSPPAPNPDAIPPEHNFLVEPEKWDDALFGNAIHFNVVIGRTPFDRQKYEYKTYPEALESAKTHNTNLAGNLPRAMIYAVTATGRHTMLVPQRWEHYSKLWEANHG